MLEKPRRKLTVLTNCSTTQISDKFWQKLESGEEAYFKAQGRSMLPLFPSGTVFILKKVPSVNISTGDIVLAKQGHNTIIHRVVDIRKDGKEIITKGDFLTENDQSFKPDQILAIAVAVIIGSYTIPLNRKSAKIVNSSIAKLSCCSAPLLRLARNLKRKFPSKEQKGR